MFTRRLANVDQLPAVAFRGNFQRGHIGEASVHSADDVEPSLQRFEQRRNPDLGDESAGIRDADDKPSRTFFNCLPRVSEKAGRL